MKEAEKKQLTDKNIEIKGFYLASKTYFLDRCEIDLLLSPGWSQEFQTNYPNIKCRSNI